ncbi:MAG: hypothetical protein ACOX9B_10545 [Candidatus Xenobium sp.]|jgi:hypothetical protein|nr:hypothetical protein [Burkholderiales bacterium]
MSDPTNLQREIDRRPIRRLEIRPLGEGASADQDRFETVLTDPTSQSVGGTAWHGPLPLEEAETWPPDAEGVRPRAPRGRLAAMLAVLLLLAFSFLGLMLVRSAALPPGEEGGETIVSTSTPEPLADTCSVVPLPVYPVPETSSVNSSVSPIPMALQQQASHPDPASVRVSPVAQDPSPVLSEEPSAQAPTDDKPVPVEEVEQETPPAAETLSTAPETRTPQLQEKAPAPLRLQPPQSAPPPPERSASAAPQPGRPDMLVSALQPKPSNASRPSPRPVSVQPRPTPPPASKAPLQVASATGLKAPRSQPVQPPAPPQSAEKRPGTSEGSHTLATYLSNPWLLLPPLRGEH